MFWNISKNMQYYFVKKKQGYPLEKISNIFLKYWYFSFATNFFSSSKLSISDLSFFKKIFVNWKKRKKMVCALNTKGGGGGGQSLSENVSTKKHAFIFTCSLT